MLNSSLCDYNDSYILISGTYKFMITIELSKQQALDADPKEM